VQGFEAMFLKVTTRVSPTSARMMGPRMPLCAHSLGMSACMCQRYIKLGRLALCAMNGSGDTCDIASARAVVLGFEVKKVICDIPKPLVVTFLGTCRMHMHMCVQFADEVRLSLCMLTFDAPFW
jgi:hypothetical protein